MGSDQARDAFYACLEKESDKKQTEIASKGLLYPAQCKPARDQFVNNCRASWVKLQSLGFMIIFGNRVYAHFWLKLQSLGFVTIFDNRVYDPIRVYAPFVLHYWVVLFSGEAFWCAALQEQKFEEAFGW